MKTSSVNSNDDEGQCSIWEPKCQKPTGRNGKSLEVVNYFLCLTGAVTAGDLDQVLWEKKLLRMWGGVWFQSHSTGTKVNHISMQTRKHFPWENTPGMSVRLPKGWHILSTPHLPTKQCLAGIELQSCFFIQNNWKTVLLFMYLVVRLPATSVIWSLSEINRKKPEWWWMNTRPVYFIPSYLCSAKQCSGRRDATISLSLAQGLACLPGQTR